MPRSLAAALLSALLISFAVSAQTQVCATGVVQPVAPSACQPGATHMLECTQVLLRSATVDLGAHVGQNVRVVGTTMGGSCPTIDVTAVGPARTTLTRCGSPRVGCPVKLVVCPVLQGTWSVFVSGSPGFFPLACALIPNGLDGTLYLGLPFFPLASGALGSCGEVTLTIPTITALVGGQLWFQGAHQFIGPVGPLEFTNAECVRIGAAGACETPGC